MVSRAKKRLRFSRAPACGSLVNRKTDRQPRRDASATTATLAVGATVKDKTGASIDLKQPAGRDAFFRLVERSDVVVENFRRGVMTRLGIDYAALRAVNEGLIFASLSSQGETGPEAV